MSPPRKPMRLNLGSGGKPLSAADGWINVDIARAAHPDFCFDIGAADWPWGNESIDEIHASHVMEHLDSDGFLHAMSEAWRVLKPGSHFTMEVPHPRSDWFTGDPTHRTAVDMNALNLFSRKFNRQFKDSANTPLGEYLEIDFEIVSNEWYLHPRWEQQFMRDGKLAEEKEQAFRHAVDSFCNVINAMKFVLERQ